jgi:DNA-binding MarR family transcriptional regulator
MAYQDKPEPDEERRDLREEKQAEHAHEALKKFRMVFRSVQQHSQWVETQCGVGSTQLWVLWQISVAPGLRVSELAEALSIHPSTASNLLDKLAKSSLIRRSRSETDQRVVHLHLTESGQAVLGRAPAPARGVLQNALFNLPDDVLKSLNHGLDILILHMKIKDQSAAMEPLSP